MSRNHMPNMDSFGAVIITDIEIKITIHKMALWAGQIHNEKEHIFFEVLIKVIYNVSTITMKSLCILKIYKNKSFLLNDIINIIFCYLISIICVSFHEIKLLFTLFVFIKIDLNMSDYISTITLTQALTPLETALVAQLLACLP